MAVGKEEVEIVKARTDKREYRRIVLKNSLKVLLISDPDTDKAIQSFVKFEFRFNFLSNLFALIAIFGLYISLCSGGVLLLQCAAAMDVGVGSFSDPEGLEGLAHFLGEFCVLRYYYTVLV